MKGPIGGIGVVLVLAAAPLCAQEQPAPAARDDGFLTGGTWLLNARYRVESADQDGPLRSALASTLRTSAGFETNPDYAFGVLVEAEDVHAIGSEKFNST